MALLLPGRGWAHRAPSLRFAPPGATLHVDFLKWLMWIEGGGLVLPENALAIARLSERGRRNPSGVFEMLASGKIAPDYDGAGAALGLLLESLVTYERVNSLLTGAVAGVVGSGGALPTGWIVGGVSGLTVAVSLGATLGLPWVGIRISGTTGSALPITIFTGPTTGIAAVAGQTWRHALYCAVTVDDPAVNALALQVSERNAAGAYVTATASTNIYAVRAAWDRRHISATLTNGATANIQQQIATNAVAAGATIDWEIRIGGPTLTQTPYLPSILLTGTSALTRYADGVSFALGSWFNPLAGTLLAEVVIPYALSTGYAGLASISDGALANRVTLAHYHGNGLSADGVISGNVGQAVFTTGPALIAGAVRRHALTWAADSVQNAVDGVLSTTDVLATIPSGLTRLDIGALTASANNPLNGWIRRLTYWPYRMPGSELLARTVA